VPVPEGDFYSRDTDLDAEAPPQTEAETGSKRKDYASSVSKFVGHERKKVELNALNNS
jgi:hypothetical protein